MNKHLLIAAALTFSSIQAMAADITPTPNSAVLICDGYTAAQANTIGGATVGTPYTATGSFIKTSFSASCSSNTIVYANNGAGGDATKFAVASASVKGNQTYKGSTTGGAIVVDEAIASGTAASAIKTKVGTTTITAAASL
ncbi:MAG: hypothetical protein K9K30_12705 [Burkholderiaceae bacterium]|nr:hypothetical protein [Sulfuritalea sp.]MCF8176091.1 hypothetical protein [Burkholderiaceae bacterium]